MKKMILFLVLILMSIRHYAQAPIANTLCDNRVSTDWENPNNESLPLLPNGDPDLRFLNGLDWVNGNLPNKNYTTTNLFFTENDPYGNMLNIKPQTLPVAWYEYLFNGEEMTPNNGWELLLVNLGRYPDDVNEHISEDQKFTPYIVLYNRYEGTIRVFVTYGRNPRPADKIDGVKIDLFFADNAAHPNFSGLLRLGDVFDDALDVKTNIKSISAVAKTPGSENRWYSADFKIAYDPCTCNYPSRLGLRFSWFSETQFELQGRELSSSNIPLTQATSLIENDFLGNYEWNRSSNDVNNGYVIYNNLTNAIDDYIEQMKKYEEKLAETNDYNATVKRNKAIAKAFKSIILTTTPSGAVASGISFAAALAGGADWAADFQTHAKDLIEKDSIKFYKISKEMKSLLGSQFDYFINKNFKEKPVPTKPSGPTIGYAEMTFKGKLRNEVEWPGIDFLNPGTYHQNSDDLLAINNPLVYKYPVYNDVLGSFALLESPKIFLSETIENDSIFSWFNYNCLGLDPSKYYSWTNNYQIKLAEPLKYTLNSNLKIKNYKVSASFNIAGKISKSNEVSNYYYAEQCYLDPFFSTNIFSPSVSTDTYFSLVTEGTSYHNGLNMLHNSSIDDSIPAKSLDKIEVQTPFISSDVFFPTIYSIGLKNEIFPTACEDYETQVNTSNGHGLDLTIDLKLLIDIEFDGLGDDGNPNKVTQVYTYRINDSDILKQTNSIVNNLENSQFNFTQYQEDLILHDKTFDGSKIDGCKLVGNVYTCKAWNDVTLTGNITANPGYVVNIEAANEIKEINECVIQGEVNRQIVPVLDFSTPMPPVTSQYIATYCDKQNKNSPYKADEPTKNLILLIEAEDKIKDSIKHASNPFTFSLFPNPTSNQVTVRFNQAFEGASISFTDVFGKEMQVRTQKTDQGFELSLDEFAVGVYLVTVHTPEGSITKQLVKK